MRKWKIFFCDGTTATSDDGTPQEVLKKNKGKRIAIINMEDGRCGRRRLRETDVYRWDEEADRWFNCNESDIWLQIYEKGYVIARQGGYLTDDAYQEILIASHEDTFVPAISPKEPAHVAWHEEK